MRARLALIAHGSVARATLWPVAYVTFIDRDIAIGVQFLFLNVELWLLKGAS